MASHSITFGVFRRSLHAIMECLDQALVECQMTSGGEYRLSKTSDDGSDRRIVARRENLERDRLPRIQEPLDSWSSASLSVWWETVHLVLSLHHKAGDTEVALVFLIDVLEYPGQQTVTPWMVAFMKALKADAALLCDENNEGDVEERLREGASLLDVVRSRVTSREDAELPIVALAKQELMEPALLASARASGVRVELMFGAGVVLFSRTA